LLYNNPYKLDDHTLDAIWNLYGQEMLRVSAGQAMDIWWHRGHKYDVSENEYLQMCAYKTGVLARFATRLGAILGKGTAKQVEALGKFGETIGVAFQIQDDILNLVGEEFQKGKGIGEDIHEGKRTLIALHALRNLPKKDSARLLEILNAHPEDEATIREAIALVEKTKSIEYARKKANELVKDAWQKVEKTLPASDAKKTLKDFADYLVEREI
jgi:geranylgeranyl pyrophosphate synthase